MKQVIWKYALGFSSLSQIEMPYGAQLLAVQVQKGEPQLWALVNPDMPKQKRFFETIGTGEPFGAFNKDYIASYQLNGGELVYHVFETIKL